MATIDDTRRHPTFRTVSEVADVLRVTPRTVRNWIGSGDLKVVRAGRRVLISSGDLEDFLRHSNNKRK